MFINCPFDEQYAATLQAIAFCVVYLGFFPRFAPENANKAVRHVRSWLVHQAQAPGVAAALITGKYLDFQEWYWKREQEAGSSEEDIGAYPAAEVIGAMHTWKTNEDLA